MKLKRTIMLSLALLLSLAALAHSTHAQQAGKPYQQMTNEERAAFVHAEARAVARKMSGTEYEFTQSFEAEIQKWVENYARRIGAQGSDRLWKGDLRPVFERGQRVAPTLTAVFKSQN